MKYSIAFASLTLGLVGTACGGFTEIGQAGSGGGGATSQGGSKSTGGITSRGGGSSAGGAATAGGNQGTANATSTGGSGTGGSDQCQTAKDCPQIGAACQLCPDGASICPTVECRAGQCVSSFPTCATQTCKVDSECPRSLAPCQLCADGTSACPWARCENGTCKAGIDRCPGTNPCAGKVCGESCSICAPDQSCPPVLMFCDDHEECQVNQPTCAKTTCQSDADCPGLGLCVLCAQGDCAERRCINGACEFSCESGGGSGGAGGGSGGAGGGSGGAGGGSGGAGGGATCSAERASCANGETCCAGLECCVGVPVPTGNEYCGKVCPKSDQNIKRDFLSVNPDQILDQLSHLPIGSWSYRTEGSTERHIGPMAQDFMAAFHVGSSDRTILQVDADGVAFAAIQALNARLEALEQRNRELERELAERRAR